jgi:glycosyltransferase involved in cell wall biosynthesis
MGRGTSIRASRMRVVLVGKYYHPYMGGIESHLRVIAREVASEVDVEIVVSNKGRRTVRDVVDGIPVTRCGSLGHLASIEATPSMALELSTRRYDLIHIHLPHPVAAATYLASWKPRGHRLIVSYHADIYRQQRLNRLYEPLVLRLLGRAERVLASSPQLLEYSDVLTRFREKVRIVPYGIYLEQFSARPEVQKDARRIRERHGGGPLLLSIGRLIYYKGFEYAIRALEQVPDAKLLLIGDGPLRGELEALARRSAVQERVIFLGHVPGDLTPYYLASDAYVMPSIARSEAFGIVQIEAMACGLPVINTAIDSGVPFVSLDGKTGLTVLPHDPSALAAAIRRLLAEPDVRARFGAAGRERAHTEFSKATLRRRLLAIYRGEEPD